MPARKGWTGPTMATRSTGPECTFSGLGKDIPLMEADYRDTFEQAAIGLAHGTTRGYILRVNRTFAAMLGYRAEELVGQHFSDITHPHDRNEQMSNVRELLGGHRERLEFEKSYIHRGGQSGWCIV